MLNGWLTTPSLFVTWEDSLKPSLAFSDRSWDNTVRGLGAMLLVTGIMLVVVVVVTLFVVRHAYQARDFNCAVPTTVSLFALPLHPIAGLFVLVCSGALEYSMKKEETE
jgi:heme/copper-type cytochrome/quinol oxidase subunit 2